MEATIVFCLGINYFLDLPTDKSMWIITLLPYAMPKQDKVLTQQQNTEPQLNIL